MGVYAGPDVSESGLVLALDGANYKSFKGEVTTNLIPSPTINAYPTTGNGWGTYNTNQYNSAQYFSIGSISSVSNNIITTSTNHPLRTYDVVRPQTTGGGVTANTNYFVKKISDTTFTLHAYNSSQDGSQGYINPSTGTHKVYDSIANDVRISVNPTSFPTMWWGAPHLPNSGLVKELRYGEFNAIPNLPANDCIRLHYIRTDGVKDGMSYGVDCTVTPGSSVTISFYTRSANANAVGKQILYHIWNYTGGSASVYYFYFTLGPVGVWERQTFTYTPAYGTMISYWFHNSGSGTYAWDWSCMQVEQKSYATNFVPGTRGDTVATGGGWADMSGNGNHGQLVNGVRESSDNLGALVFDGSNDYIDLGSDIVFKSSGGWTVESWVKYDVIPTTYNNVTSPANFIGSETITHNSWYWSVFGSKLALWNISPGVWKYGSTILQANTWYNAVLVCYDSGTSYQMYLNGIPEGGDHTTYSWNASYSGLNIRYIGRGNSSNVRLVNGKISTTKVYDRALTASEIQQNFNATRGRYGI